MAEGKEFVPQSIAELADGSIITPESKQEEQWLSQVADNPIMTQEQKERVARMGVLFTPSSFDVNFDKAKRANYPTDLDPQLRQMIKES